MRAVVIYSGGMDSSVLLYDLLLRQGFEVKALGVNYGQRHAKELYAAKRIAEKLGVEYRVADLRALRQFMQGSSQTDAAVEVPDGHYEEGTMRKTVVPNRNSIMLNVAAAWAISLKYDAIAYAAHAGDHAQYPDCRPAFVNAMRNLLSTVDWSPLELLAPFSDMSKADIARLGADIGVPFEETWSCYKGLEKHCGFCGTCQERVWAFQAAGVLDPTVYEAGGIPELFPAPKA